MIFIGKFILTIIVMGIVDAFYTLWAKKVQEGEATASGIYASLLILASSFNTILFIDDNRLIPALVIGAFMGTYITVKREGKKK